MGHATVGSHLVVPIRRCPGEIYDGSFTGARVPGDGVTAQLLQANGIAVFGESEIETLLEQLDEAQEEAPSFF